MITRTLKQVKVFDIKAKSELLIGHGFSHLLPEIQWVKEQIWESEEECNKLLQEAITDWENRQKTNSLEITPNKPELIIYWQTVKIEENSKD